MNEALPAADSAAGLPASPVAEPAAADLPIRAAFLHRPRPPDNSVPRPRLLETLDRGLESSTTLVCAPAGFGKSILVSQWAESIDRPVAWLSLDGAIDDPRWFVMHLAEAVRRIEPDALNIVAQMTSAPSFPDVAAVISELSNELEELSRPIVIVLDDYHQVASASVHEIVSGLTRHPSASVHLVIVTRREPALPTGFMRLRGQLRELRMAELAFTKDELDLFARQELHRDLDPEHARRLHLATEGWPAGVRLAIEARRLRGGPEFFGVSFLDQTTQDDLIAELLDQAPPAVRWHLQIASRFPRFSAELCDAVSATTSPGPARITGAEFIDWLRLHSLFIIQLDDEGIWYRFHHLFAQLLDNWGSVYGTSSQVQERDARIRAASVFRAHGLIEDAIEQLHLAGSDPDLARMAAEFGFQLVEEERWPELERLLTNVPDKVLDSEPELLVLHAWLLGDVQSRHGEMSAALDRADAMLLRGNGPRYLTEQNLRGQIVALRAAYERFTSANFEGAVAEAEAARELLASSPGRSLTFAYVLGVLALAGAGRPQEAHRLASSVLGDERFAGAPFDPMAWALPLLGWLEGDLALVERHAAQLLAIGEGFGLPDTVATAHYFLGIAAYERNRLDETARHLNKVLDLRYATQTVNPVHSWIALALADLAQGRTDEAHAHAAAMMQFVLDTHSDYLLPSAEAFVAWLELRRGRSAAALRWAHNADPEAQRHRFLFFDPSSAYIEVLLSSQSDADRARQLLEEYLDGAERRDHRPLTIRLLALRALDHAARGDERVALESLERCVRLAQEGDMIRSIADLGPTLVPLLHRLDVTAGDLAHVGAILAAIGPTDTERSATAARVVPTIAGEPALTPREVDVLRLLAARKSNKEIARELFIAPGTVKKNAVRLYDKLNVHGRQEAVAKARTLGYLQD